MKEFSIYYRGDNNKLEILSRDIFDDCVSAEEVLACTLHDVIGAVHTEQFTRTLSRTDFVVTLDGTDGMHHTVLEHLHNKGDCVDFAKMLANIVSPESEPIDNVQEIW